MNVRRRNELDLVLDSYRALAPERRVDYLNRVAKSLLPFAHAREAQVRDAIRLALERVGMRVENLTAP